MLFVTIVLTLPVVKGWGWRALFLPSTHLGSDLWWSPLEKRFVQLTKQAVAYKNICHAKAADPMQV